MMAYRYRSAVTGRFVTKRFADLYPDKTILEKVHPLKAVFAHAGAVLRRRAKRSEEM
jgi:hypothetical protein